MADALKKELFEGTVYKRLKEFLDTSWLKELPDQTAWVNFNKVHLVNLISEIEVLLDYTGSIPLQDYLDEEKEISMRKFSSKRTRITNERLYAITYELQSNMLESHINFIRLQIARLGAYNLSAPNTTTGNVVLTSGVANDLSRKSLTIADVIKLKKLFDKANVALNRRILVLNPDHVADLLLIDGNNNFRDRYSTVSDGSLIANLYGFKVYEYTDKMPVYTLASGVYTKAAFETAPSGSNFGSSFAFAADSCFKALGTVEYFETPKNAENHHMEMDIEQYANVLPLRPESFASLVYTASA